MATLLERPLIEDTLKSLPGWHAGDDEIWRDVKLPKDLDAELRREVESDSEAMGHSVSIERTKQGTRFTLTTHDVGGVSELDVVLASRISDVAHRLSEQTPDADEPGVTAVRQGDLDVIVEGVDAGAGLPDTDMGSLLGRR
jgi:4a-hydroxytetrahydrobiopterin dehydratase